MRQCYYQRTLRKALADLPKTLDETYHRILKNIPEENLPDATTILRLLAWSERPLRIGELIDAIAVQPNESPSFCVDNRMPEPRDLLKICSSLVVLVQRPMDVNEKDDGEFYYGDPNTVESDGKEEVSELRLAHFSVKEYLMSHRVVQSFTGHLAEDTARARIATICLTYLRDLDHNLSLKQMKARFQFAQYCARYWTDHARKTDEREEDLQRHILEFFEQRTTAYTTCYSLYDPDQPEERNDQRRSDDVAEPLYYASLGGLVASVARLLDESADANAQGGLDGNALQAASDGGHDKVVQMLLDKGADVNAQGGRFGNALRAASYRGHDKIVQTLLDKGADVNAQGGPFGNALQAASYEGHDKIVQLLLDKGADVNAQGGRFCNAPNAAAFAGHLSTLIRFFGHSTLALQVLDAQGRNTLHLASCGGHVDVFQYLLVQGLNPRQLDNRGNPMLSYSAAGASLEISQKILKLELGYRTDARWSPLHWACRKGNVALVKLLLAHGSNDCGTTTSNIPGKWTPHAIAIMHQNTELVSSDRILNHSSPLSQHLPPDHLCFSYAKQHGGFTCDGCQQVNLLCLSISIETDSTGYLRPTIPLQRLHGLRLLFYVYVT